MGAASLCSRTSAMRSRGTETTGFCTCFLLLHSSAQNLGPARCLHVRIRFGRDNHVKVLERSDGFEGSLQLLVHSQLPLHSRFTAPLLEPDNVGRLGRTQLVRLGEVLGVELYLGVAILILACFYLSARCGDRCRGSQRNLLCIGCVQSQDRRNSEDQDSSIQGKTLPFELQISML